MSKLSAKLKPIPNIQRIKGVTKPGVSSPYEIEFVFKNENEYFEMGETGIGAEWEFGLKPIPNKDTINYLTNLGVYGKIINPSRFDLNTLTLETSKAQYFHPEVLKGFLKVIAPNASNLLLKEPHVDTTLYGGKLGGPEMVFQPISPLMTEYLRIDMERVTLLAEPLGMDIPDDSSFHLHTSTSLFGKTKEEFSQRFCDFVIFLFENREFMLRFSSRIGAGLSLADFNYYLDDAFEEKTPEALKRTLLLKKSVPLQLLKDLGYIRMDEKGGVATADDRVKGWCNMVVNDEHETVEFRWFGSSSDAKVNASKIQWMYAILEFIQKDNTAMQPAQNSLERFIEFLVYKFDQTPLNNLRFGHLWNQMMKIEISNELIQKTKYKDGIEVPIYTREQILDFSAYEVADAHFQKVVSDPTHVEYEKHNVIQKEDETETTTIVEDRIITSPRTDYESEEVSTETETVTPEETPEVTIVTKEEDDEEEDDVCCSECYDPVDEDDENTLIQPSFELAGVFHSGVCGYCKTSLIEAAVEEDEEDEDWTCGRCGDEFDGFAPRYAYNTTSVCHSCSKKITAISGFVFGSPMNPSSLPI